MNRNKDKLSVDSILTFAGLSINIAAVTFALTQSTDLAPGPRNGAIAAAVLGLLIHQLGSWHVASQLLANRQYHSLRAEVVRFIGLVQRLNAATVAHDIEQVDSTRQEMYKAVDRIVVAAGVTQNPREPLQSPTRETS